MRQQSGASDRRSGAGLPRHQRFECVSHRLDIKRDLERGEERVGNRESVAGRGCGSDERPCRVKQVRHQVPLVERQAAEATAAYLEHRGSLVAREPIAIER